MREIMTGKVIDDADIGEMVREQAERARVGEILSKVRLCLDMVKTSNGGMIALCKDDYDFMKRKLLMDGGFVLYGHPVKASLELEPGQVRFIAEKNEYSYI